MRENAEGEEALHTSQAPESAPREIPLLLMGWDWATLTAAGPPAHLNPPMGIWTPESGHRLQAWNSSCPQTAGEPHGAHQPQAGQPGLDKHEET